MQQIGLGHNHFQLAIQGEAFGKSMQTNIQVC